MAMTLTLAEAFRTRRLDDFTTQAEGVGVADEEMFERLLGALSKRPNQKVRHPVHAPRFEARKVNSSRQRCICFR